MYINIFDKNEIKIYNYKRQMEKIAVIGLGYVGLPLAVEFGKKYRVIGYDINGDRINELRQCRDHTLEADLDSLRQDTELYTLNRRDLPSLATKTISKLVIYI